MRAENWNNLPRLAVCIAALAALPLALMRCQQLLFSDRSILEAKGAHFIDPTSGEFLIVDLSGPAFADRDVARLRGNPVVRLSLQSSSITDAAIEELLYHPELSEIDLSGTNITRRGIGQLTKLPKLMRLRLENCRQFSVDDLKLLKGCPSLRFLTLGAVSFSPDELRSLDEHFPYRPAVDPAAYLGTPRWLRPIWLEGERRAIKLNFFANSQRPHQPKMLPLQFAALHHRELVEELHLYFVDPAGPDEPSRVEGLETYFPQLHTVCIATATDAELATLAQCPSLRTILLLNGQFTDAGLAELAKHRRLQRLSVESPHVQGEGLGHLGGITSLEVLEVHCAAAVPPDLSLWKSLHKLRSLKLEVQSATDNQLKPLSQLSGLELLRFGRTELFQVRFDWLSQLPNLRVRPRQVAYANSDIASSGMP